MPRSLQWISTGPGALPWHVSCKYRKHETYDTRDTDDGTAIHYVGTEVHRALTEDPAKSVFSVQRDGDGVREEPLDAERLTRG